MASQAAIINHNINLITDTRKHNKGIADGAQKSFLHEIDCTTKDVVNEKIKGRTSLYMGGPVEIKETLSHKIYVLQCRLSKESKIYRGIVIPLRKTKNFISGLFRRKYIPGLPRYK